MITVVNLDVEKRREGLCIVPDGLALPPTFRATDMLRGEEYEWRVGRNFVGLEPGGAHVISAGMLATSPRKRRQP